MNPGSILFNSILGEDDEGIYENYNDARKTILINYFNTKFNERYENSKGNKYYYYGNTSQGSGWYYPLYIDPNHVDLSNGTYHNLMFDNNGMVFYMPNDNSHNAVNSPPTPDGTYTDYSIIDNSFIPIPFYDGDKLAVKLTYYPKHDTIAGHNIGHRSYKVILNLKEDTFTNIFSSLADPVYNIVGFSSNNIYARSKNEWVCMVNSWKWCSRRVY